MARILLVDDEVSIREFLELLLTRAGHVVESAGTLADARTLLPRGFELVISDFRLGKDSGIDVLKAARALNPAPEVIIITAYGTPASAVQAMRQGAYDYISKPFDNDELLLLVDRALEKSRLSEENRQLRATLVPRAEYFAGTSPPHAGGLDAGRQGRPGALDRVDHRRERHWQRSRRARDSHPQPARVIPLRAGQLRRAGRRRARE